MSFWKKLFEKKKSKSSKSELKEETRIISNGDSEVKVIQKDQSPFNEMYDTKVANNVLSAILEQAINSGDIKRYVNIDKFIKAYPPLEGISYPSGLNINIPKTKEIEKLANNWYKLSYKCSNVDLANLMLSHFR